MGTARGYSESELGAMVQDVESDLVERKESLRGDAPTGIREAICAFANDLPDHQCPGVVFVGVNDAGRPTGPPITDALLRQLADIKTDGNIVPPPTLTVGTHAVAGHEVAVVTVQPADDPRPTICGILILGKHPRDYLPGAYVQFLRIAGTALDSPIVDERLFDGPIGPLIASVRRSLGRELRPAGLRHPGSGTGAGSTSPAERSSAQRAGGGAARVPASAGWYTLPAGTGPGDASGDRRDAGRQRPVSVRPRAASPSPGP